MLMIVVSHSEVSAIVHPEKLPIPNQVVKNDPTSGKMFFGDYEPIDQEKNKSEIFELDANLRSGFNLEPQSLVDYSNFDARLQHVESFFEKLSSKKASLSVMSDNVESSNLE